MSPRSHMALQKLGMMAGAFLTFGIAIQAYNDLKVNIALMSLWMNLLAYIGPIMAGGWLGYWVVSMLSVRCPKCRGPVKHTRCATESTWQMPDWMYWCANCERDVARD